MAESGEIYEKGQKPARPGADMKDPEVSGSLDDALRSLAQGAEGEVQKQSSSVLAGEIIANATRRMHARRACINAANDEEL